ncbi:hypothetical protein Dimus_012190 [Dionaea muscipula]
MQPATEVANPARRLKPTKSNLRTGHRATDIPKKRKKSISEVAQSQQLQYFTLRHPQSHIIKQQSPPGITTQTTDYKKFGSTTKLHQKPITVHEHTSPSARRATTSAQSLRV